MMTFKRKLPIVIVLLLVCVGCGERGSYPGARNVAGASVECLDGDTFRYAGTTIRLLGADTPEIAHPERGETVGQPYGDVAMDSAIVWISRASRVEIVLDGKDRYERTLGHVFLDGELLSVKLIRSSLAYETVTHYGDNGFPDLAQIILDTSRTSPRPPFEPPHRWRKRQRENAESGKGR